MQRFRNKYRIESARLSDWDYSLPGYYFVTLCTHNRKCLFGEIIDSEMLLNGNGRIVHDEWHITGNKYNHIRLDEFMVMPNHIHGIIQIVYRDHKRYCRDVARNVSTGSGETPTIHPKNEKMAAISPISGSLPVIMRSFKSAITKRINETRSTPGAPVWQPRFHDHVIRNEQELFRIRQYIVNNPLKWKIDTFNNGNHNFVRETEIVYAHETWMI